MVEHIKQQLAAAASKPAQAPQTPPKGQTSNGGQETAIGGRSTPKEQPRPAGHNARYGFSQSPHFSFQGYRFIADDLTKEQADALARAARSANIKPYNP